MTINICHSLANTAANILKIIGIDLRESRQGVKDILVSFVPQIVGVLSGLISSILIARGLGPAGLGNYALILSYVSLASLVSDLGMGNIAIRYASMAVASGDMPWQRAVLQWALKFRLLMAVAASVILALLAPLITDNFWHNKDLTPYIYIALIGGVFAPLATIPTIYFQSNRKFSTNSLISSVQRIIGLLGILLLSLFSWWHILYVLLSSVLTTIVGAFAFILAVPRDVLFGRNDKLRSVSNLKAIIKCPGSSTGNKTNTENPSHFVFSQMLLTIIITLSSQADIWLMGFFLNKHQIGIYSAATRFTLPFGIIIATINTALWPRVSACITSLSKILLLHKIFKLCLILALFGAGYSYIAPLSINYIFGDKYSEGVLLAQLLCAKQTITLFYCSVSSVGYSMGMIRHYVWIAFVCFIVLMLCNIFLLPRIGFYGAAIGLITSEVLQMILGGSILFIKYREIKREVLLAPEAI